MRLVAIENWPAQAERAGYRVDRLAELLGVSRRTLGRHWHEVFGCAPQNTLDDWWRAKAEELLRARRRSVKEIAAQAGYSDASAFTRAFRRGRGISPRGFQSSGLSQTAQYLSQTAQSSALSAAPAA